MLRTKNFTLANYLNLFCQSTFICFLSFIWFRFVLHALGASMKSRNQFHFSCFCRISLSSFLVDSLIHLLEAKISYVIVHSWNLTMRRSFILFLSFILILFSLVDFQMNVRFISVSKTVAQHILWLYRSYSQAVIHEKLKSNLLAFQLSCTWWYHLYSNPKSQCN